MIKVLYFASLRERLGQADEQIDIASLHSVSDLLRHLRERGGVWSEALAADQTVLVAINQEIAAPDAELSEGDEVGLFPPVTGG